MTGRSDLVLAAGRLEVIGADLPIQRADGDTEAAGRARAMPVLLVEDALDLLTLQVLERRQVRAGGGRRHASGGQGDLGWQVRELHGTAFHEQREPLREVAELAHVAGPAIPA